MDSDLLYALIDKESNFNPYAQGSSGERGLTQLMPANVRHFGVQNPEDPIENALAGEKLFEEELDRFGGNTELALAAYNAGSPEVLRAIKAAGGSTNFEDVERHLPTTTRSYVPDVMNRYKARKEQRQIRSVEKDAAAPSEDESWGTAKEFATEAMDIATQPGFAERPTKEKIQLLSRLYDSRNWLTETNDVLKNMADAIWKENPDALPNLDETLGLAIHGKTEDELDSKAAQIKKQTVQGLREKGINPYIFGSHFDNYFEQKVATEKERLGAKDRGFFGTIGATTGEFLKGATSFYAGAAATFPEVLGEEGAAKTLREAPDKFFGTHREFDYELDENGDVKKDDDGEPITRWRGEIIRQIGGIAGFLAGGEALGAAGLGLRGIATAMGGANVLYAMDRTYNEAKEEGADHNQALAESFAAVPFAAAAGLVDATIFASNKPWIGALSPMNRNRAMAQFATQAAITSGAANVITETGIAFGVGLGSKEDKITAERLGKAFAIGALPGAFFGAYHGRTGYKPPPGPPPPKPEIRKFPELPIGLPAPEVRLGLPVPENRGLPEPPSGPTIQLGQVADAATLTSLTKKFEDFQKTTEKQIILEFPDTKTIPPELLNLFPFTAQRISNKEIAIIKKETYQPPEIDTKNSQALSDRIEVLTKELSDSPHPEDQRSLIDERKQLKQEFYSLEKFLGKDIEPSNSLAALRKDLQNQINENRSSRKRIKDPTLQKVLDLEYGDLQTRYDQVHEGLTNKVEGLRAIEVRERIEEINKQLKQLADPLYTNNLKAQERELIQRLNERKTLNDTEGKFIEQQPFKELAVKVGTSAGDRFLLSHKDKWYVMNGKGEPLTAGHWTFKDALNSSIQASQVRTPEITPMRSSPRTPIRKGEGLKTTLKIRQGVHEEILPSREKMGRMDTSKSSLESSLKGGSQETAPTGAPNIIEALPFGERSRFRITPTVPQKPESSKFGGEVTFSRTGEKPVPVTDVMKKGKRVLKILDSEAPVSISEGGRMYKGKAGYFSDTPQKNFGKIDRINDFSTLAHEMAHAVRKFTFAKGGFDNLSPKAEQAFIDTAETHYPGIAGLAQDKKVSEGFSMFIQHLVTGQKIHRDAKAWFDTEFAAKFPKEYRAIEDFKETAHEYGNQSAQAATTAFRSAEPEGTVAKIWNKIQQFYPAWVERHAILSTMDKVAGTNLAEEYESQDKTAASIAKNIINNELHDLRSRPIEGKTAAQIFKPIEKAGEMDKFLNYMVDKRAMMEYVHQGKDPGNALEDVAEVIKDTEQNYPHLVDAANEYWANDFKVKREIARYSDVVSAWMDRIAAENLKNTGEEHGFYLPFVREGKGRGLKLGASTTGSARRIENPLTHIEDVLAAHIRSTQKLGMLEKIAELGTFANNSPLGAYVHEVTEPATLKTLKADFSEKVSDYLGNIEKSADSAEFANLAVGLLSLNKGEKGAPDGFHFLAIPTKNGPRFFEVANNLYKVFSHDALGILDHPVLKVFVGSNKLFRLGATSLRGAFMATNLPRDTLSLWRRMETWNPVLFTRYVMEGLMNVTADKFGIESMSKWIKVVNRYGYDASTRFNADTYSEKIKSSGYKIVDLSNASIKEIENLISIPEKGLRVASWLAEKDKINAESIAAGLGPFNVDNPTDAQRRALGLALKRGTTNFGVQGYEAQKVNRIVSFFTARIAETDQFFKDFHRHPGKTAAYLGGMIGFGISHFLANKDERWNQELSPEERLRFAHFPVNKNGDKRLARLPLDSLGGLGFLIGQGIGNSLVKNDALRPGAGEFIGAFVKGILPIDASFSSLQETVESLSEFGGPLVKETIQQMANKDFYFNRKIVPEGLVHQPAQDQFTKYTTNTAKWIAETVAPLIDISPMRLEHFIRSSFPVGMDTIRFAERITGKSASRLPSEKINSATDIIGNAYLRYGLANDILDRSSQKFYDAWQRFEANRNVEEPIERSARLKLEEVEERLSAVNAVLTTSVENDYRDKLLEVKKQLIDEGIAVARGEVGTTLTQAPKREAKQIRVLRKKEASETKKNDGDKSPVFESSTP